ncbi:Winged helix-turn-helix DNA-binding [Promicromonospora umidemergens]|uniref:Homeodomain-like domain-containing protein n=1 Tax=Promicromonospora umidemergens TaxID=629679 RepID=A0ABP8WEY9_9MICO|nr:winged helix-turn-helix transcriptional regulator [Promicromonospora umidemergens]MCP2286578.1 Winged helix-turn-helix DNA-binding [Promicromonospora umidemergens]
MAPADRTFPVSTVPTRRSRRLVLTGAISVALISTGSAYLAMVQFGIDVLAMNQGTAYATAGVFELSLVTVALLAREAARDNRPGGTLLALTWALSSASGVFAAWHEAYIGHPVGAVVFRFIVPLLAALMWHLALIGDRHLATGTSWSAMRQSARMHALFLSTEDLFRAQSLSDGSRAARRRLARAEAGRRRARSVALRTVPPREMRAQVAAWCEALAAVGDGTADVARLHLADRQRLTGILVDAEPMDGRVSSELAGAGFRAEVGVPGCERRAAEAIAAEFGETAGAASDGLGGGVFDGEAFDGDRLDEDRLDRGRFDEDRLDRGRFDEDRFDEGRFDGGAELRPARRSAALDMPRHGVSERAPQPDPVPAEPAEAADRATANVREAIPPRRTPRRNTQLGTQDAERMIDLRTKGRTYREIAEEVGVSSSTVGKRMREFTETGSIPVVKPR